VVDAKILSREWMCSRQLPHSLTSFRFSFACLLFTDVYFLYAAFLYHVSARRPGRLPVFEVSFVQFGGRQLECEILVSSHVDGQLCAWPCRICGRFELPRCEPNSRSFRPKEACLFSPTVLPIVLSFCRNWLLGILSTRVLVRSMTTTRELRFAGLSTRQILEPLYLTE